MPDHTVTFEQIDAAFAKFDAGRHEAAMARITAAGGPAGGAAVIGEVCPIYKAVRPFLVAASNLPFIPAAWRNGIKAFIAAMDLLCP
jgi:hypothetical protein